MSEPPDAFGLQPTQSTPRRRVQTAARWAAAIVVAAVLVLTVVAIVNQNRNARGVGGTQVAAAPAGGARPALTPTRAACPLVTDEVSHLSYRCIDNYLRGDYPDATLGLSTTLDYAVEPNWEIVQGSGLIATSTVPTLGTLQQQVRLRTDRAIKSAYGAHPIYRTQNHIKADLERLWVVGLPTRSGVGMFMLTIPDNRKDLWPKAAATVATVHVV